MTSINICISKFLCEHMLIRQLNYVYIDLYVLPE